MNPPPFPATEADLDAWHVYADSLIERGDPRGELIALELAVPSEPTAEELARFHAAAKRLTRHRSTPIAWCLNHVRTVTVERSPWAFRYSERPSLDDGTLFSLAEFVSTPIAARLERLYIAANAADAGERGWRRFMRRLPSSCHTIALELVQREAPTEAGVRRMLDELPPGVRRLRLTAGPPELFIDDRLDEVVLPFVEELAPIAEALARTRRVRLRVGGVRATVGLASFGGRIVVGDDGDALLRGADGALLALEPTSLLLLQRRFGLIPIRTQLARTLPERYGFARMSSGALRIGDLPEAHILRHPDGRFTLRSYASDAGNPSFVLSRNGAVVSDQPVVLVDGDRVTVDGSEWLFSSTGGGRAL